MSKIIIAALCFGFFVSCQTKAANENTAHKPEQAVNVKIENSEVNRPVQPASLYSPTPSAIPLAEVNSRIGNVENWSDGLCFIVQNPDLQPNDKIQVIMLESESPQEVFEAEVAEKKACKGDGETVLETKNTTEYLLKTSHEISSIGLGVGIVNPISKAKVAKGIASIDIDGNGKDEYFRDCAGFESSWISVWEGKPLAGKRIWYSQYYLRYDVDETCKKKDYEGIPEE
jgi:hypothetical protein